MQNHNEGNQSGNNSVNVGIGDFRGANVNVGEGRQRSFTPEELKITRTVHLGGLGVQQHGLNVFSIVSGAASILGLYFTIFAPFPDNKYPNLSNFFMFLFLIAAASTSVALALRKKRFEHFLARKYYLERSDADRIVITSLRAVCPWCRSPMNLRNVGHRDGPRYDRFICERNPRQHTIDLDPTSLPDVGGA